MSNNLAQTIKLAFGSEGGWSNHPADPGGATKYGITASTLGVARDLRRKATPDEVRALSLSEAAQILDKQYAQPLRYAELPPGLDYALFDFSVNSGPAQAVRILQRILVVEVDGIVGVKTLNAIRDRNLAGLIDKLQDARLRFLKGLKTWPTFGKGWSIRVEHVRSSALKMAAGISTVAPAPPEGRQTASPRDVKVSSTPAGKGTITATIGTAGAAIGAAKDSLQPLTSNGGFADTMFTVLIAGGVALTVIGLAVVTYQQIRHRETAA
ncbi:glycoside hydrolase family 108 protein [Labrys neptuniae]